MAGWFDDSWWAYLLSVLGWRPGPARPTILGARFRPVHPGGEATMENLVGTVQLSTASPDVAKRLVTYTVNGNAGGVIDVAAGETFTVVAGAQVTATAVDVSAGGVSSLASEVFTIMAVDNTTVPQTPTIVGVAFAPSPVAPPSPAPAPPASS